MHLSMTWGSGAAVEFLSNSYPQNLAKPDDSVSMLECVRLCLHEDDDAYSSYLKNFSKHYSIDNSVKAHVAALR